LLIIDELGYFNLNALSAANFFRLVSERYQKGSIIITSNLSYGSWGELFGDTVLAGAVLDRLLHHSSTLNIKGNSYRLKDKLKAGIVSSREVKSPS
jgi:DNA replication protein DnaC